MTTLPSETFAAVRIAISEGRIQVSRHAVRELEEDALLLDAVMEATLEGEVVEDYPTDVRGPSCLVLSRIEGEVQVHTVWGFDEASGLAVLITAYRPDPTRWDEGFRRRRS